MTLAKEKGARREITLFKRVQATGYTSDNGRLTNPDQPFLGAQLENLDQIV